MNVGFFLVQGETGDGYVMADLLLRSIRKVMPGVPVSQFTDLKSPAVYGVDHVLRKPSTPLAQLRTLHQACVEGEWLFVDTDVIVQQDVRHVFRDNFDIAVSDRNWTHMAPTPKFTATMPWNIGVIFSRAPWFWRVVHQTLLEAPQRAKDFMGDQYVVGQLLQQQACQYRELPGMVYNYPPNAADDPGIAHAAIVHYKGNRKRWMLERVTRCA